MKLLYINAEGFDDKIDEINSQLLQYYELFGGNKKAIDIIITLKLNKLRIINLYTKSKRKKSNIL